MCVCMYVCMCGLARVPLSMERAGLVFSDLKSRRVSRVGVFALTRVRLYDCRVALHQLHHLWRGK